MLFFTIEIIIYFLKGHLVVIWMRGLVLIGPLMMLLILLISFILTEENVSLILITSAMLVFCLEAWVYNLGLLDASLSNLLLLKNLDILWISLGDLAGIRGRSLLILARSGSLISVLVFLGVTCILEVNLDTIFLLSDMKLLFIDNTS